MIPIFFAIWNWNKDAIIEDYLERKRQEHDEKIIQEMYDLEAKYLKELWKKKEQNEAQANSNQ